MSNKSMPGLVKVGFSTKDPDIRAQELNHTGAPHPYVVDYEALVQDPYKIEQLAHARLREYSEGKEWFRCTAEVAISAIKHAVNDEVHHENFRAADRAIVDAKRQQERLEVEKQRIQRERETNAQRSIDERVANVRKRHDQAMRAQIKNHPFWMYWLGGSGIVLVLMGLVAPNMKGDFGPFLLITFFGAIVGLFIQAGSEDRQKNKPAYKALEEARERDVAAILNPRAICKTCSSTIAFDPLELELAGQSTVWKCTKCNGILSAPSVS